MDLKYLQYIVEIDKEKNISKAAKKLYISQPTLSVYLSKLEEELGTPLFLRDKNELILTEAGSLYIAAAKKMLEQKEELYRQIAALTTKPPERIAIGFFQNIAGNMISDIYPKFLSKYPNVRLDFSDGRYNYIYDSLMKRTLQLAFLAVIQMNSKDLSYVKIKKEEFILAVPREMTLSGLNEDEEELPCVSLNRFKTAKFILATKDTIRREIEDDVFHQYQFTPEICSVVHNINTTINIIEEGNGAAIIPKGFMDTRRNISYYALDLHPYWNLVAAYKKDTIMTPAEQTLIALAKEYYRTHDSYTEE